VITLKPDALILPDFNFATVSPFMEKTEAGKTLMGYTGYNGFGSWTYGATIGLGIRPKGDNLNPSFLSNWATDTQPQRDAKAAAIASWWNRLSPWFSACPATGNTCTNAGIRITGAQCYVLNNITGLWSRVGGYVQRNVMTSPKYFLLGASTAYVSDGASARIFSDAINIPAFPFCPNSADWNTADPTTTIYRIIHATTMDKIVIDASTVGGVFAYFDAQLVSTNGQAFNATPDFLIECGIDAYINDDGPGTGSLLGAPYVPNIAISAFKSLPSDGSRGRYYIGTFMGTNTYKDNSSQFQQNGGIGALTSSQFQSNMPSRVYQPTL